MPLEPPTERLTDHHARGHHCEQYDLSDLLHGVLSREHTHLDEIFRDDPD